MARRFFPMIGFVVASAAMSGCATQFIEPVDAYTPAIDPQQSVNPGTYHSDLAACRAIARNQQAQQQRTRQRELTTRVATGAAVGAVTGHLYGNVATQEKTDRDQLVGLGIAAGAAQGLNETRESDLRVHQLPRDVLDRCLTNRGHTVLN